MSDGIVLKINDGLRDRKVEFFNKFRLKLTHDSVGSIFSFNFFFDPDNLEMKALAKIGGFAKVLVEFNEELIITGKILSQEFPKQTTDVLASFSGYSLPGVLDDSNIPPSIYPLQSNGLTLEQIARKLISPFPGLVIIIDPVVQSRMSKTIKDSTSEVTQKISDYLSSIASQKNIIMSHTAKGELLFTTSNTGKDPILDFDDSSGDVPGTSIHLGFNGQGMHSQITVMKQASIDDDDSNAGESTIKNPYVLNDFRPRTIIQSSGDDNDTGLAARRALGNELKNIRLTINTDRWDINGKLIRPNNIITVISPKNNLRTKERWFIESVDFEGDQTKTTAVLNCVLPEVYNDKEVISIF